VGVRFRLVFQPRYQDIIDALATGRVDLAWLSPQTYVAVRARSACVPVVQILRDGDTHYDGVVLVRKADAGAGLAGLRRRRFAFIDRDSASGYHYPLRWLRAQGAEPEAFFDSVAFAQSHSNALLRLQNGTYDAVATERGILRRYAGKLDVAAFEVLAVTGRIPNGPIAAREGFDAVLARGMADVLVGMRGSPEGSRIIAQLEPTSNVSGFASVEAGVYDEVHAVVAGAASVAGAVTATASTPAAPTAAATAPGSVR
jgi:phosphate/phosphite/phosphonate ABC transporter binding protein